MVVLANGQMVTEQFETRLQLDTAGALIDVPKGGWTGLSVRGRR